MSDTAPIDTASAPVAETGANDVVPRSQYDAEVRGRIAERNLYAPLRRAFDGVAPEVRDQILTLAELVRNGDTERAAEWMRASYTNLTGAELVAAQINAEQPGAPAASAPAIDPTELIARAVAEAQNAARTTAEQAVQQREFKQQVDGVLGGLGYNLADPVHSESAAAVVRLAQQLSQSDPTLQVPDAIRKAHESMAGRYTAQQAAAAQAAAAAAGQTPGVAPTGQPVGSSPSGMTPRERMAERFRGQPA